MKRFRLAATLLFFSVFSSAMGFASSKALTAAERLQQKSTIPQVVVFLSPRCPNSEAHIGQLKSLTTKYPHFQFFGVHSNSDEQRPSMMKEFAQQSLPFEIYSDPQAVVADQLKAFKTPHVFIIGADGKILYRGGITNSAKPEGASQFYLKDALEDITNRRSVRIAEGRTLGCIISRGKKNVW